MSVIWGIIFQTQIRSCCKLRRGLATYISLCSAPPLLLQCNSPTGSNAGQAANDPFEVKVRAYSGGEGEKKINVQDSYAPVIVPSAAVLVNTEVTQSTAALPPTPGSIFYEGELRSCSSLLYNKLEACTRTHKKVLV